MANIVELREMSGDKLNELLENAREEMFNLRFQNASARLDNYSRLKAVRREIAQLETVLNMRRLAKSVAAAEPEVAEVLAGKNWQATARFNYEDSVWRVVFTDEDSSELASVMVDLNQARPSSRKRRHQKKQPHLVTNYEIAG